MNTFICINADEGTDDKYKDTNYKYKSTKSDLKLCSCTNLGKM